MNDLNETGAKLFTQLNINLIRPESLKFSKSFIYASQGFCSGGSELLKRFIRSQLGVKDRPKIFTFCHTLNVLLCKTILIRVIISKPQWDLAFDFYLFFFNAESFLKHQFLSTYHIHIE